MKKRWQDREYRAKMSATLSAAMKKHWQNPEPRAKQGTGMKERWQDPEYRAKMSATLSTVMKERWQDPEYRAKMSAIRQDPEYQAKQRAALSTVMKERWQDPEYRAKMTALPTANGIARFDGITTMSINGSQKKYLVLIYADGKLYVPIDQINRVQSYKGKQPQLNCLDARIKSVLFEKFGKHRKQLEPESNDLSMVWLDSHIP